MLATFTSSEHGLTSACRAWSAKSPRPLWTPRTARHVHIPTLHGATSTSRSTWCRPDLEQTDLQDLRRTMTSILMQTWSTQMSEHAHVDGVYPFPAVMQTRTIETNGTSIPVGVGGPRPAVVMLHALRTTAAKWGHLASALIEDHMIVAPAVRGSGLSSKPDGGYDKKNQAADVV